MRLRSFQLSRVFPPSDGLANAMFRVCSLREDLAFEMQGLIAEELQPFDSYDSMVRRVYFLRRASVSLFALEETLTDMHLNKYIGERKAAGDPDGWIHEVREKRKVFDGCMGVVRTVRHKIGAHLDPDRAAVILDSHGGLVGALQIDRQVVNVAWKIVAQATALGLLGDGVSAATLSQKVAEIVGPIRNAHEAALMLVDQLMFEYLKERGLWTG